LPESAVGFGCGRMDRDFLLDLFSNFSPVTLRRMFSGFGISADGVNFALSLRAGLYFRADEQTIPQFEAEGSRPFQYATRSKTITVGSYWQLPARLFDRVLLPRPGRRQKRKAKKALQKIERRRKKPSVIPPYGVAQNPEVDYVRFLPVVASQRVTLVRAR
jgi:DNA transformation protein and related proteins